jgi:hypothetical protein
MKMPKAKLETTEEELAGGSSIATYDILIDK